MSARNDWQAISDLPPTPDGRDGNSGHKPSLLPSRREGRSEKVNKPPAISLSEPFPLLEPGCYVALCTEATFAWARQWKKNIARLVLEPQNYEGCSYVGRLCAFFGLGKNPERPYAGPQSRFRRLFVEVNGAQPTSATVEMSTFVNMLYEIEVVTVTQDRDSKPRAPEHWYSIVRQIHPCRAANVKRTPEPSNLSPSNSSTQRTRGTLATYQHSNTVNTPLAKEMEDANRKLVSLRDERAKERNELG